MNTIQNKRAKIKCTQIESRFQKFAKFSSIKITMLPLYVKRGGTDKGILCAVRVAHPDTLRRVNVLHSAMWWKWVASVNHKAQLQQGEHQVLLQRQQ